MNKLTDRLEKKQKQRKKECIAAFLAILAGLSVLLLMVWFLAGK